MLRIFSVALLLAATVSCISASRLHANQLRGASCDTCLVFMEEFASVLGVAIDGGTFASCTALCSYAFKQWVEVEVCSSLCTVVGLEAFMAIINKEDLGNAPAVCEKMKICKPLDCDGPCAKFDDVIYKPHTVNQGETMSVNVSYTIEKQFSTFMIQYKIFDSQQEMKAINYYLKDQAVVGNNWHVFTVNTDEAQTTGAMTLELKICEGSCEYTKDDVHSKIYDTTSVPFDIVPQ